MDLAATHVHADLDALASLVAVWLLHGPLELVVPGGMDPESDRLWHDHSAKLPALLAVRTLGRRLETEPLGRLVVVDTANPKRLGLLVDYVPRFAEVIAFDTHPPHPSDLPRASLPQAAATISGLVLLLAERGLRPTPEQAGLFLVGIHQETGHFTYATTHGNDHRAAALCSAWGAPVAWTSHYVPRGFTREQLRILEAMARDVEFIAEGGYVVALACIELPAYYPDLAILLEQLREAEQWPAAVLVASCGDRAFCIGRSRRGLDAGEILRSLGGGGHAEAASAVLKGVTLTDARRLVRDTLVEFMGRRLTAAKVASQPVVSMPATASIREVHDEVYRRRINAMPLVRGTGKRLHFIGVVSRQDLDAAVRHGMGRRPAHEVMGQSPVWVAPDTPLHEVRAQLIAGPRRLLLVGTPPGSAVGVLTRGRVLRAVTPDFETPSLRGSPPSAHLVLALARRQVGSMWEALQQLAALGAQSGWGVFLVGGTVRDVFLNTTVRDLDVLVEGDAPTLATQAAQRLGGHATVREGFATATWTPLGGQPVDLASARSEYYEAPAALPKVVHASLGQDLYRRDFTINAMAVALSGDEAGRVVDPFGGFADLRDGVLRVLHGVSFHDDPTRALRAARFAARLDFKLAPDTEALLRSAALAGALSQVSLDRLGAELTLILEEDEVVQAFRLMRHWGVLTCIHPDFDSRRPFLERLAAARAARFRFVGLGGGELTQPDVLWIVVASAVPQSDRQARLALVGGGKQRRRHWLGGPERVAHAVARFGRMRRRSSIARVLQELGDAELVVAYAWAARERVREILVWWITEGRHITSSVDGRQLLALGYSPGPLIRRALDGALDVARDGGGGATEQLAAAQQIMGRVR